MLDEQHGELEPVARLLDERPEPFHLVVAKATGRLVEQEQPGLGDQRPGELDPLQRP